LCKSGKEMQGELDELKILERKDHEQGLKDQVSVTELYDPGYTQDQVYRHDSGYMHVGAVGMQEYGEIGSGLEERPMQYY